MEKIGKIFSNIFCHNKSDVEAAEDALKMYEPKQDYALAKYDKNVEVCHGGLKKPNTSEENADIKTLGEALRCFDLLPSLKQIEKSLKDVRRHRKNRGEHESDVKQFDKKILKLCHKHHPDRVKNRGGTDEDIEAAKNMQASLNALRTAFSILSKLFLDNIAVDHMYGFCTGMSLSSIGSENEVKQQVCEVLYKISYISEIKQQNIIPSIRGFLSASKDCLKSFMEDRVPDFEMYHDVALSHLRNCIMGYIKLQTELEAVDKAVKGKSPDNICELIKEMSEECARDLGMLRGLKKAAKGSLNGSCEIIWTRDSMDDYFVLPFVYYVNLIVMCNVIVRPKENKNVLRKILNKIQNTSDAYEQLGIDFKVGKDILRLYHIASFFSNNVVKGTKLRIHWSEEEEKSEHEKSEDENVKDETMEVGKKEDENMKVVKSEVEKKEDEKLQVEKTKDENVQDEKPEVVKKAENMKDEKSEVEKKEDEKLQVEKSEDEKAEVEKKDENMKDEKPEVEKREDEGCDREKQFFREIPKNKLRDEQKEYIKSFKKTLKDVIQDLEKKYKEENYVGHIISFVDIYAECLRMMEEFNEKEKKMREGLEKLERKHQDIEEMLENMFKKSSEVGNETMHDLEEEQNNS